MKTKCILHSLSLLSAIGAFSVMADDAKATEIIANFGAYTCTSCGIDPSTTVALNTDPQAMAAINAAVTQIGSQFTNNVNVNILFVGVHAGTDGFLGASEAGATAYTYAQYTGALASDAATHPQNTALNTAVANLSFGNQANDVLTTTADARALGLTNGVPIDPAFGSGNATPQFDATGDYLGGGGTIDGVIFLNLDQPLSYTRPIQDVSAGVAYDAQTTMGHEIDEVLGIGGQGSVLNTANSDPNYAADYYGVSGTLIGPMDLYRYAAPGVPSFDYTNVAITGCPAGGGFAGSPPACSGASSPYFSVDGGRTAIDTFNQAFPAIGGDAGDWGLNVFANCPGGSGIGGTGDVQDAFSCNNHTADVKPGTPSYLALEAIGYNPLPEPGSWAMMLTGFAAIGSILRRRSRRIGYL